MISEFQIALASRHLEQGAVITYPTEGVYGLGCLATETEAVLRLLHLKRRDVAKGLILLVDQADALRDWIGVDPASIPAPNPKAAVTWIVPAGPLSSDILTGGRETVAVRVTLHPGARALCENAPCPIISTSANQSGGHAIRRAISLRKQFTGKIGHFVPGKLGTATGSSEIRDLMSGTVLRAGGSA